MAGKAFVRRKDSVMLNYFQTLGDYTLAGNLAYIWAPIHELGHIVAGILTLHLVIPTSWNSVAVFGSTNWLIDAGGVLGGFLGVVFIMKLILKKAPKLWFIPIFMASMDIITLPEVIESDFGYMPGFTTAILYLYACSAVVYMLYLKSKHDTKVKEQHELARKRAIEHRRKISALKQGVQYVRN